MSRSDEMEELKASLMEMDDPIFATVAARTVLRLFVGIKAPRLYDDWNEKVVLPLFQILIYIFTIAKYECEGIYSEVLYPADEINNVLNEINSIELDKKEIGNKIDRESINNIRFLIFICNLFESKYNSKFLLFKSLGGDKYLSKNAQNFLDKLRKSSAANHIEFHINCLQSDILKTMEGRKLWDYPLFEDPILHPQDGIWQANVVSLLAKGGHWSILFGWYDDKVLGESQSDPQFPANKQMELASANIGSDIWNNGSKEVCRAMARIEEVHWGKLRSSHLFPSGKTFDDLFP